MSISAQVESPFAPRMRLPWWRGALVVVGVLLLALLLFVTLKPIKVLPRMTLAPGLSLVDSTGERLTALDLFGSVVLYNFTWTRCAGDCPAMGATTHELQETLRTLDTQGIPVRIVTVSFDPAHDTPDVLAAWAQEYNADPALWSVATGEPSELKSAIGGAHRMWYEEQADGTFSYDPMFVLVDGAGFLRARYRAAEMTPAILTRDLGLVINEAVNSTGINRLVYEAAHQFLCYP